MLTENFNVVQFVFFLSNHICYHSKSLTIVYILLLTKALIILVSYVINYLVEV